MAEEYSAGTISADLTVDATGLNKGVNDANDGFDRLERKLDEVVAAIREGMGKATEATKEATEEVKHHQDALHELKEAAEAVGLYELFKKSKEIALESVNAFDEDAHALRSMQAAVNETDSSKFEELAERLSDVSSNTVSTEENAISLASRFGLTDQAIAELLPRVQDFAARTGKDLPSAMQAFSVAMASGEASPRRLGIALNDMQKEAFKAGDESQRLGILMQALGKYAGGSADDLKTAGGALRNLHKENDELLGAIGGLLDKPLASFFNTVAEAVNACRNFFEHLNEPIRECVGFAAALTGGLATLGIGLASAYKALGLIAPLFTSLGEAIPVVVTGVRGLSAAFIPFALPILGAVAAITGLTIAYGAFRNAIENKEVPASFGEYLKQSVERTKNDLLGIIGDFHEKISGGEEGEEAFKGGADKGLDFGKDADEYSYQAFGKANAALAARKSSDLDFGHSALDGGEGPFDALNSAIAEAAPSDDGTADAMKAKLTQINSFIDGMNESFARTTDANTDLQEAIAKAQDDVLQGQADQINQAGGIFTEAFAGITANMTAAQRQAAMANVSGGAQAGGVAVNALASAGGPAGAVAGGLAAAATGNPIGLAAAGMALLEQSKSFQTIMSLINKTLSVLVQAINPILNAVIPALTVVLSIVGDVVKTIIKNLTPLMAPIMKLVTTIVLIAKPFIEIFNQLQSVLIPILTKLIVPVINALSAALMFVAKIVIDGIVNPLIEAWDAIIDAIDDVLGWLGVDLSSLKMHTISLEDDADAVDSVTDSMNQLDQSSQNIPEGYKVALSAFNAAGSTALDPSASAVAAATPTATLTQSMSQILSKPGWMTQTGAAAANGQKAGTTAGTVYIPATDTTYVHNADGTVTAVKGKVADTLTSTPKQSKFAVAPSAGSTPTTSNSTTNMGGNNVVIQAVHVQAATSDLLAEMQKMLKNKGYLSSGTNVMGASQRTQYGSA